MKPRLLLYVGVPVLVAALGLGYCSRSKPVAVAAATIDRGAVRQSVANTRAGTINACRRAKLAPATGGPISALNVKEGDRVRKGQVLIELWNADSRAQFDVASRDASAAEARAEEACTSARIARRDADRYQRMREQKLVAEDAAERAVGQAEAQEAGCRAAQANIKVAAARVATARATLERSLVRAPFDGTVAEINGELGEFVTPSPVGIATPPSIDLIDDSCLYITAPIDEVDAPLVKTGMTARISLDAFPGRQYAGHVRRVAPYVLDAEKQARTVEIEAEIDSTEGRENLLPGYSADVEVVVAVRDSVLRVPTQALLEGKRVLVIDAGDVARARDIKAGIGNWEYTEVLEGLQGGDRVITSIDREGVKDGAQVAVEAAPQKPAR
jgi:HlyD family secretion protein